MDEITAYCPGLSPVEFKELWARFDGGRLSSDGGVLELRRIEERLGLAARRRAPRRSSAGGDVRATVQVIPQGRGAHRGYPIAH